MRALKHPIHDKRIDDEHEPEQHPRQTDVCVFVIVAAAGAMLMFMIMIVLAEE
jgi:hypothetical protein